MAQVTYRGVQYDTETRLQEQKIQQPQQKPVSYTHLTLPTIYSV